MQTREWTTHDKSTWGEGPWQTEPDKRQWRDEATGLACLIVRNNSGSLCGYVGVPPGHPCYGINENVSPVSDLDAHGGITFADRCQDWPEGKAESSGVCHLVEPGESDDVWWLGFDCAHALDLSPVARYGEREQYRDLTYVTAEVEKLAGQLAAMRCK